MGAYENYTRFYESTHTIAFDRRWIMYLPLSDVDTDQVGFHALYSFGSNPGDPDCTSGITTRVVFVCNKDAQWNNRDVTYYIEVEKETCFVSLLPFLVDILHTLSRLCSSTS